MSKHTGEGFRAICSCGWRWSASWNRAAVAADRDGHKKQTRLERTATP